MICTGTTPQTRFHGVEKRRQHQVSRHQTLKITSRHLSKADFLILSSTAAHGYGRLLWGPTVAPGVLGQHAGTATAGRAGQRHGSRQDRTHNSLITDSRSTVANLLRGLGLRVRDQAVRRVHGEMVVS
jgi:hypothetical protein